MLRTFGRPQTHRRGRSCRRWRRSHPTLDLACLGAVCSQASSTGWSPVYSSKIPRQPPRRGKDTKGSGVCIRAPEMGLLLAKSHDGCPGQPTRRLPGQGREAGTDRTLTYLTVQCVCVCKGGGIDQHVGFVATFAPTGS
jgi:hypothetical protein